MFLTSQFSPVKAGAIWLDASTNISLNANFVSNWVAYKNELNAGQADPNLQPEYSTDNGANTILFYDPVKYLSMPALSLTNECGIYIVFKNSTQDDIGTSSLRPILVTNVTPFPAGGSSGWAIALRWARAPGILVQTPDSALVHITHSLQPNGFYMLLSIRSGGGTATVELNDLQIGAGSCNLLSGFDTGYNIGAQPNSPSREYAGNLKSIAFLPSTRPDDVLHANLKTFFYQKYQITI